MSKSEPDGCLFLTDSPDVVFKKLSKAKTDQFFGISYDLVERKPLSNLIDILCLIRNANVSELSEEFNKCGHQQFKEILAKAYSEYFSNLRDKYNSITETYVKEVLQDGTLSASKLSSEKLFQFLATINK